MCFQELIDFDTEGVRVHTCYLWDWFRSVLSQELGFPISEYVIGGSRNHPPPPAKKKKKSLIIGAPPP